MYLILGFFNLVGWGLNKFAYIPDPPLPPSYLLLSVYAPLGRENNAKNNNNV